MVLITDSGSGEYEKYNEGDVIGLSSTLPKSHNNIKRELISGNEMMK